jgi:hypothetical protein
MPFTNRSVLLKELFGDLDRRSDRNRSGRLASHCLESQRSLKRRFRVWALCQGTTLVVPQTAIKQLGFSPCYGWCRG